MTPEPVEMPAPGGTATPAPADGTPAGPAESEAEDEWDVEAEIEATVAAIRAEALAEDVPGEGMEVQEAGGLGAVGCGAPGEGGGAAGADFILYGVGLVGLLVAAGRRQMRGGGGPDG